MQKDLKFDTVRPTPGPWHRPEDSVNEGVSVFKGRGEFIATTKAGFGVPLETMRANARLIAAAPEMLEALTKARAELLKLYGCYPLPNGTTKAEHNLLQRIDAAIEKATGGE